MASSISELNDAQGNSDVLGTGQPAGLAGSRPSAGTLTAAAGDRPTAMLLLPLDGSQPSEAVAHAFSPSSEPDAASISASAGETATTGDAIPPGGWQRRRRLFKKVLGSPTEVQHESSPALAAKESGESPGKSAFQRTRALAQATAGPKVAAALGDA